MLKFSGTIGTGDNVVVKTLEDKSVERYGRCLFRATAGVIDVELKLNGTWSGAVAITDMQSVTPATKVLVTTTTTNIYMIEGPFEGIRFLQNGVVASNVEGALLSAD